VAIVESSPRIGGAGINTGTVPSKTLREAALYYSGLRQRGLSGLDYSLKENLSVADLMSRNHIVVENELKLIEADLHRLDITLIRGKASFKDAHTVRIRSASAEKEIHGEVILIATGSSPVHPPGIPFDEEVIFDTDTILQMDRIPKRMAVVGGGVIGTEYASIFNALDVNVILVEPKERILPFVDTEMIQRLAGQLKASGLRFALGYQLLEIEPQGNHVYLHLEKLGVVDVDVVLMTSGRQGNVQALGLDRIGVKTGDQGLIIVNENYQTSVPDIYAAGDVIGFPALASTSMEQARLAMVHAFDRESSEVLSPLLPLAIYTIPEISFVGLTEDDCRVKNIPYRVGRAYYENSPRGQIIGDMSGMLKLVFSPDDGKLLGAHLIGEQASELIHLAGHVLLENGPIQAFLHSAYNYPTLASLYKVAAMDGLANL
jgi:NAD(P) transhydrogenase